MEVEFSIRSSYVRLLGGQSTHFQMLSKVSRPLVKRYIIASGIALSELYSDLDALNIKVFRENFSEELKEFNKGKDYDFKDGLALLKKYLKLAPAGLLRKKLKTNLWVPVVESSYFFYGC